MKLTIHRLTENDIPALAELSREVGWDYDEAEMKAVLASGVVYGHKTPEGTVVSSSAVILYGEMAALGLVIVREAYRRQGLARGAVKVCLDLVPQKASVMLFATEEGKPLYREFGFEEAGMVYKYTAPGQALSKNSTALPNNIRMYESSDWNSIQQLDHEAFGEDREVFLRHRFVQAYQSLVLKNGNNQPVGFGLSIWHEGQLLIGPVTAPDERDAAALVEQLIEAHPVKVRIDLTAESSFITKMLGEYGFEKQSEPHRMVRHPGNLGSRNGTLYAIASQVFG
ncbi:GNAT family N-acetyltransferase [Marinococcus luteus]|uniref:GNAT family N-acetyltransferase n=1 Tax=Marinococcus luteus TaxID=1122204 RepID=UPI002ACC5072|nr:GNAT family N-acetyltransferase [Marinococcus luteus]MDZ5784117.1 GNAT family N-acetyltransferase [Marinococcus luteus]